MTMECKLQALLDAIRDAQNHTGEFITQRKPQSADELVLATRRAASAALAVQREANGHPEPVASHE